LTFGAPARLWDRIHGKGFSMKRLLAPVALILAASAGPVNGQSIGLFYLGQSQAEVARLMPNADFVNIVGRDGVSLAQTDPTRDANSYVLVCEGTVSEVATGVGRSLHAYAATVEEGTASYGAPTFRTSNTRTANGEISWQDARWQVGERTIYRVVLSQGADAPLIVTRSFIDPTLCAD
jgi:hypothetical protein